MGFVLWCECELTWMAETLKDDFDGGGGGLRYEGFSFQYQFPSG